MQKIKMHFHYFGLTGPKRPPKVLLWDLSRGTYQQIKSAILSIDFAIIFHAYLKREKMTQNLTCWAINRFWTK